MKKLLLGLLLAFTLNACGEYAYVEAAPIYADVTRYGVPHYFDGRLWYYSYNGLYYYVFHYNGNLYLQPYKTPRPWNWYYHQHRYFRPNRFDKPYKFDHYKHNHHKYNWNGRRPNSPKPSHNRTKRR